MSASAEESTMVSREMRILGKSLTMGCARLDNDRLLRVVTERKGDL